MYLHHKNKISAFTLLEMLLVLVVISSIFLMGINYYTQKLDSTRRAKVAQEALRILNAGVAYYQNNSNWGTSGTVAMPEQLSSTSKLVADGYIPANASTSWGGPATPWGGPFYVAVNSANNANTFQVSFYTPNNTEATIVAGRLPIATASNTQVIAEIGLPTKVLNNARAINFTGLYHSGSCVPAPNCPPGMNAVITVTPSSVSGVYDLPTCSTPADPSSCTNATGGSPNTYSLKGYTASAIGDPSNSDQPMDITTGELANCSGSGTSACEYNENPVTAPTCNFTGQYTNTDGSTFNSTGFSNGFNACCPSTDPSGIGSWTVLNAQYCQNTTRHAQGNQNWLVQPINMQATTTVNPTNFTTGKFWRVCLQVISERGTVSPSFSAWGQLMGTVLVTTKCMPPNEESGSNFTVFQ